MILRPFYYDDILGTDLRRARALAHDAFVEALSVVPPKPAGMEGILAANRGQSPVRTVTGV